MQLKNLLLNSRAASVALALAATSVFTTGCANMASTATGDITGGSTAAVSGHLHGGNQPVSGATVQMYTFGLGYGATGSLLATTTSASDGAGSWSFTPGTSTAPNTTSNIYTCPTANTLVYVIAKGGNTQGTGSNTNNAAVFLAPLGQCGHISTAAPFTDMSEVTTVATMAALQQYFNPNTDSFGGGTTGTATTAVNNAMALVPYLVNLATGTAVTSKTISFGYGTRLNIPGSYPLTETPDSAKINTLANILASCINSATSSSSNCMTLFNNATPPSVTSTSLPSGTAAFTTATDVAQALYYMLANPSDGSTTNLGNLYSLPVPDGAPFGPALGAQPTDWTIAITYSATAPCNNGTSNVGAFISSPTSLATDRGGDIWFTNAGSGNLSEIGPPTSGTVFNPGGAWICGPTNTPPTTGNTITSTVIDSAGNLWGTTNGTPVGLVRLTSSAFTASTTYPTTEAPVSIAADGNGNIYYASATGKLYVLVGAATSTTVSDTLITSVSGLGTSSFLVVDSNEAVWATTGSSSVVRVFGVSPYGAANFTATPITTESPTYGIGVSSVFGTNSSNNIFYSLSSSANGVGSITGQGTSYSTTSGWPQLAGAGGLAAPNGVAVDSRSNVWLTNGDNISSTGSISAFTSGGTALSPASGDRKALTSLNNSQSAIVDISGNLWVGGIGNTFITEIVGVAPPVYQPAAVTLKGNASLLQTAP